MQFELNKTQNGIRHGKIETNHGTINTPFFMPVGTVGSVKGISPDELRGLGAQIVLSNTYHLYLRPGEKLIKKMGGLHEFMRWDGPILTDSGGYQVFSLGKKIDNIQNTRNPSTNSGLLRGNNQTNSKDQFAKKLQATSYKLDKSLVKVTEDGVEFTSHLDGSKHFFTPEKVIDIQLDLGVDILMPLDVCPSGKASNEEVKEAVDLTIKWAKRAKRHFDRKIQETITKNQILNKRTKTNKLKPNKLPPFERDLAREAGTPSLFGIIQGGLDPDLRRYCAEELIKLDFDGYAVGGLAVDHETRDMWQTVGLMGETLPEDKPRYLMGVGTPDDIRRATMLGMDMFDCVLPTRLARHGSVFVSKNGISKSQFLPLRSTSYEGQVISNKIQNSKSQNSKNNLTTAYGGVPQNAATIEQFNNNFKLLNLLNSKYRTDPKVIEEGCHCPACVGGFSRAYISHLIRSNEILGMRLATLHNLHIYLSLLENQRTRDI